MTTPDGYCAWNENQCEVQSIVLHRENAEELFCEIYHEYVDEEGNNCFDLAEKDGWQIKPVKILTIEEYERLKKLEEWTRGLSFRRSN